MSSAKKILVIEDTFDIRTAIEIALEESGYQVRTAENGQKGLAAFQEFRPDLILLDVNMPGMSGTDVLMAIRESSAVPVVMFSAANERDLVVEAIARGANDFVLKETGIDELLDRVGKHVGEGAAAGPAAETASHTAATGQASGHRRGPSILIADSEAATRETLVRMSQKFGYAPVEAHTGAEALSAIGKSHPDVIILDLNMPDMDGIQLLKTIAGDPTSARIPMIIASTRASPETYRLARYYRVVEYMVKPWDESSLELTLRRALDKARQRIAHHAA